MGGVKDLLMDDLDLIPEDTSMEDIKEMFNRTYELVNNLSNKIEKIEGLITQKVLVNKSYGRPRCKIYYEDREITDAELKELRKTMPTAEILKDFKYINEYNQLIIPAVSQEHKQLCRNMIANRTR